ncbi:hypothetical protein [Streptomyces griseosporeus]|uniref:hypothetical protein n=1 Tax=Streptomyces griseosporeus TaxID=1910 RepID=UPI0037016007
MGKRGTHVTRLTVVAAAVLLVTGAPVAVWGLMGQQNAQGLPSSELDYAFQPPDISDGTATAFGGVALALAVAGAALLVLASLRGAFDHRWWGVLAPLTLAGILAGVGWRVLTAGVIGANIGAGLALMLGTPLLAGLLLWAVARALWLAWERAGGGKPEPGVRV